MTAAKLTAHELEVCLAKLAAYFPGTWDAQRSAVWAQELAVMPFEVALRAITEMARAESFPTVARLLDHAGRTTRRDDEALVVGDAIFLPGTGWLGGREPETEGKPLALGAPSSRDEALRELRAARARFEIQGGEDS